MTNRSALIAFLLATSFAAAADDRAPPERGRARVAHRAHRGPGYFITPWGDIVFPDAPPPSGDTSTFSGPGPNVSQGPEVGAGPEVSTGPTVGTGP